MGKRISNNPSLLRSQKLIRKSLLELMEEKPYEKITIGEITKRADLVRRTFYTHYKTKEEILECYIDELINKHIDYFSTYEDNSRLTLAEIYFKLWGEHIDFVLLLKKNNMLIMLRRFENYLDILNEHLKIFNFYHLSSQASDYAPVFYARSLWDTLDKWIDNGMKESPSEISGVFNELIGLRISNENQI